MDPGEITRKDLDNQQFLELRQVTEKIAAALDKRLKGHLAVLKALFIPRKLFGTYIKSAVMEEVAGSDKAFAELQEKYAAICEKPFGLPKKLQMPLPPISNQLEATPLKYHLTVGNGDAKATSITCPTKWILAFRSDCPLSRLNAMLADAESAQPEEMKKALVSHLTMVLFLKHFPALTDLLQDLRYEVIVSKLTDLGGLPVAVLKAPLDTFLPSDEFIRQITQLSGIRAFQEIIDLNAVDRMPDPLKESLRQAASG
jgi:hypothetical protein